MKKRIVFSQGGKGGVGKTLAITSLYYYLTSKGVPVYPMDLDDENKDHGSFQFWVPDAKKVRVRERDGLDVFLEAIDKSVAPVILVDLGARMGTTTFEWFKDVASAVSTEVDFTMVSAITSDISTVTGLIEWGSTLKGSVQYVVLKNPMSDPDSTFVGWDESESAEKFRKAAKPLVATLPSIHPDLMTLLRSHGISLYQAAKREHNVEDLKSTRWTFRSQGAWRQMEAAFDATNAYLLPGEGEEAQDRKSKKVEIAA